LILVPVIGRKQSLKKHCFTLHQLSLQQ